MKATTTVPSLGTLQLNVEKLRLSHNLAKRKELSLQRQHKAAVETSISAHQSLLNGVAELDEAAASLSRSARS